MNDKQNINVLIVEKAIDLAQKKGSPLKSPHFSGFAQQFEGKQISVIYTTPFSGAEVLPGELSYIVDIWYKRKKVYSFYYKHFDEVLKSKKRPKGEWVNALLSI